MSELFERALKFNDILQLLKTLGVEINRDYKWLYFLPPILTLGTLI